MPTTRRVCPVDECGWFHDDNGPDPDGSLYPRGVAPGQIDAVITHHMRGVEAVIREHVETHTAEQYLRTIRRLESALAVAQRR